MKIEIVTIRQNRYVCEICLQKYDFQHQAQICERDHLQARCNHLEFSYTIESYDDDFQIEINLERICKKCKYIESIKIDGLDQESLKLLYDLAKKSS